MATKPKRLKHKTGTILARIPLALYRSVNASRTETWPALITRLLEREEIHRSRPGKIFVDEKSCADIPLSARRSFLMPIKSAKPAKSVSTKAKKKAVAAKPSKGKSKKK